MVTIDTITETNTALEQCGDLFRSDPIGCNMVAASLSPAVNFELLRVSDDNETIGTSLMIGDGCHLGGVTAAAAEAIGETLSVDAPITLTGEAAAVASVAGRWSERCDGAVIDEQMFRMYRLGELRPPSKRRKGRQFVSERERIDQAAQWGVGFGADTGLVRTLSDTTAQMERAVNESRLIEWRVKGEVVSQLLVTAARFGVVRIGFVYTPPEFRKRGHASGLTAAVAEQQMARQKVDDVILNTQARNASTNKLYRRLGFESVREMLTVRLVA